MEKRGLKSLSMLWMAGIVLAACTPTPDTSPEREQTMPIILSLGDPRNSHLEGRGARIDKHPAGLSFHERQWGSGNHGTVTFEHGTHSFTVENVLSVMGTQDRELPSEGIHSWDINFGVSVEQADTHEAARTRVMELLAGLRAAGWQRYIASGDPRLSGQQAWQYAASSLGASIYSLDSTYEPTLEEWKALLRNFPRWLFVADGAYLEFQVLEANIGRLQGKTTYLLSIEIQNEYAFYGVGYFWNEEEKKAQWQAFLPAELEEYHLRRAQKEAELTAQGYTLDASYQDPPIKALQ